MGSSDSLSPPSEPPDIRNWFSSYVYESPELNTIDGFKDSSDSIVVPETQESPNESKHNLEGNVIFLRSDDLVLDKKDNSDVVVNLKDPIIDDNHITKVLEYSDSLSLGSEPPDIKKWFSSYAYESPSLDTYEFRFIHEENEAYDQENDAKIGSEEKEVAVMNSLRSGKDDFEIENIPSDGLLESIDVVQETQYEESDMPEGSQNFNNGSQNSAKVNDFMTRWSLDQSLQKKIMQDQDNCSANDSVIPGNSEADYVWQYTKSGSHQRGKSDEEALLGSDLTKNSSKSQELSSCIDILESAEKIEFNQDVKPMRKTGESFDKENETEFADNGFISTRKSRSRGTDTENSFKRPFDIKSDPLKGVILSSCSSKEVTTRRKVLLETTNFQSSNLIEVTGKWKCPQKSKPNLGPPLKQLRLDQWVHRI